LPDVFQSVTHCLITDFQEGQWRLIDQNIMCAKWQAFAAEKPAVGRSTILPFELGI